MNVMYNHMGSNFASTLLIIGGVGLAVHYEQLCNLFDGVPLIVAWGKPVSGKTTAAKAAMALIGQQDAVGGMQALTLPFCFAASTHISMIFLCFVNFVKFPFIILLVHKSYEFTILKLREQTAQ